MIWTWNADQLTQNLHTRLVRTLTPHLSPITLEVALVNAMRDAGTTRERLDPSALEAVVKALNMSLRMFVPESELPVVMLALADIILEHT